MASGTWRSPAEGVWLACLSDTWFLCQASQSSEAGATEEQFLILVPPARPVALKMGLLGLLPVLAFFILLGGVQEPELVEGFFGSKYWGLGPPSRDMEIAGREE